MSRTMTTAAMATRGRHIRHALTIAAVLVLAAGCALEKLPTAPDDLNTGVVIYQHANFVGESAYLTNGVPDLRDYEGPCQHENYNYNNGYGYTTYYYDWNDCISSVKVIPGWRATIYVDPGFDDDSLVLTADEPNLALVRGPCKNHTWNDCISSIRVSRQ